MKAKLLSAMIILLSNVGYGQNTLIPDSAFEQALIDAGIDTDGIIDGDVATADISGITTLNIVAKGITDLTGIEDFAALQTLNCGSNVSLGTLNLSNNLNLYSLNCGLCGLTSLTLPNTSTLVFVNCFNNSLTSLDVSGNPNLDTLDCNTNPNLGSIDVSSNTKLRTFYCNNTGLTSLDVSQNTLLLLLHFGQNNISTIDLSNNLSLRELYVQFNALTELDVSKNTIFIYLFEWRFNKLGFVKQQPTHLFIRL